ncbi:MAG: ribbon-helix-helix protein, CopG family [Promethearchaeota archaeon]
MPDKNVLITIKINKNTLEKWDEYCQKMGISRSQLIRDSVESQISNETAKVIDDVVKFYFEGLDAKIRHGFQRIEALILSKKL